MYKKHLYFASLMGLLFLSGCSSHSDISTAKQTKALSLNTNSVHLNYTFDASKKNSLSDAIKSTFKEKQITLNNTCKTKVLISPVYIGSTSRYQDASFDEPVIPQADISQYQTEDDNSNLKYSVSRGIKAGTSRGVGMNETSIQGGVEEILGTAVISATGSYAINSAFDTDGYEMVTDVYVNDTQRTRIFAYVEDGSIEPEEAIAELSLLTANKLAVIIKGEEK